MNTNKKRKKKKFHMKRKARIALSAFLFLIAIALLIVGIAMIFKGCSKFDTKPEKPIIPIDEQSNPDNNIKNDLSGQDGQDAASTEKPSEKPSDKNTDSEIIPNSEENPSPNTKKPTEKPQKEPTPEKPDPETENGIPQRQPMSAVGAISKSSWNLLLTNKNNPLPESYNSNVSLEVGQKNSTGSYEVDSRIVPYLKKMLSDAKADGIELVIRSGYRTHSRQKTLYWNRVDTLKKDGYFQDEAEKKAATINAYPGTSEHETGLAVDILTASYGDFDSGFEKTDAFKWLYKNSYLYGFIMRYPSDKKDLTFVIYEPWHYRFVGPENASVISSKGLCLEEYILEL